MRSMSLGITALQDILCMRSGDKDRVMERAWKCLLYREQSKFMLVKIEGEVTRLKVTNKIYLRNRNVSSAYLWLRWQVWASRRLINLSVSLRKLTLLQHNDNRREWSILLVQQGLYSLLLQNGTPGVSTLGKELDFL